MSGQGRKQPNRGGKARRSQPASKGSSRTASAGSPPGARSTLQKPRPANGRTGDTQPVADVRSRRPPAPSAGSNRAARQVRADRKKRNQRVGVVIGAVALGGAAIGSVIAGMSGNSDAAGQTPNSPAASSTVQAVAGPTAKAPASTAPATLTPMAMTCPTGGGATTPFGHEIVVPAPYSVTISYGDGDQYTNDSAHLGAIFSHTYAAPGTYTVKAVLTDPTGGKATATCDYTWGP